MDHDKKDSQKRPWQDNYPPDYYLTPEEQENLRSKMKASLKRLNELSDLEDDV